MEDRKFLFLPFGFWVTVLGLITLYLLYRLIRIYLWPKTEGIIIKSEIQKDKRTIAYDYYYPHIEYKYTVNGKEYISNRIFLTEMASDYETIKKLVEKFPEGSKVKVYYNPFNPSDAVLKRNYHTGMFIQTLVFFSMLSVFLYTLIFEIIFYGSDLSDLANIVKSWLHSIIYGE
ncbi:DUF3592 domain-containing protein [Persephonella sp. KM09-Lau-8]|uniref:DUF3592 domain-containing protein n=1 Tax=Persephonella sp. KM09-Lau-8 TaxID=1158345 RepID=UPI00068AD557|nr:DUF3592 domain-containing protein [Persephonella sp. KM09-Lau-8]